MCFAFFAQQILEAEALRKGRQEGAKNAKGTKSFGFNLKPYFAFLAVLSVLCVEALSLFKFPLI